MNLNGRLKQRSGAVVRPIAIALIFALIMTNIAPPLATTFDSLGGLLPDVPVAHAQTPAKYIIMFNGDGMAQAHIDAGACYINNNSANLNFEDFPQGNSMTHDSLDGITDSAASATAWAIGSKVANGVISMLGGTEPATVLEMHKAEGRRTGIVSTAYISDASPAAWAAHDPSRGNTANIWNDYIGQTRPNVIFGGGGNGFSQTNTTNAGYNVVTTRSAFNSLDPDAFTHYAAIFGSGEIAPVGMSGRGDYPTLPEMTVKALAILDNDPDGFFLFVEHEGTDTQSHAGNTEGMVKSVDELVDAVQEVINWVNDAGNGSDWNNTLVVVTGDHKTGNFSLSCAGMNNIPTGSWSSTSHSSTPVAIYSRGQGAGQIQGSGGNIDNTDVYDILRPAAAAQVCSTVNLNAVSDTYIDEANSVTNFGSASTITVDGGGGVEKSAILEWDLSSIPSSATVTDATITLQAQLATPVGSGWIAYNDMLIGDGESQTANTTNHGYDATSGTAETLVDYSTGASLSATVNATRSGPADPHSDNGANTASGTDAYMAFNGIVGLQGVDELDDANYDNILTFENLDASKTYNITLATNRANPVYEGLRWARVTIEGADSSTNASSSGVTVNSPTSVSISIGDNTAEGYVAKWTDINPGSDGTFSVKSEWDNTQGTPGGDNTKGYAMGVFALEEVGSGAPTPTYDLYEMKREWVEAQSTWINYAGSNGWETAGAKGANDRGAASLGILAPTSDGPFDIVLNSDGLNLVQTWVNNGAVNQGIIIADGSETNAVTIDSREGTTVPKLTVSYCEPIDIGDEVWLDSDGDGLQTPGEPSLGGIMVELWRPGGDTVPGTGDDEFVKSTLSVAGNGYGFSGVSDGDYFLRFIPSSIYVFTTMYAGGATEPTLPNGAGNDSDADASTGRTEVFTYSGTPIDSVDAGLEWVSFCYAVADNNSRAQPDDPNGYVRAAGPDALYTLDFATGDSMFIGLTNTGSGTTAPGIEAIAFGLDGTLYAGIDMTDVSGQLATLNTTDGSYTPVGSPFGSGMNDPDGLTYDTDNHWLWVSNRSDGEDELFAVYASDCATNHDPSCMVGAIVPEPFGVGSPNIVDVKCDAVPDMGEGDYNDVDDIAYDPIDGVLYGICNAGYSTAGTVVEIDITGSDAGDINLVSDPPHNPNYPNDDGPLPILDYEGMTFGIDGQLYVSSGWDDRGTNPLTSNRLYTLDKSNVASASLVGTIGLNTSCLYPAGDGNCLPAPPAGQTQWDVDFEALACLVTADAPPDEKASIGNYVWLDENSDGYQDAGEPGLPNVRVDLYDDGGAVVASTRTDAHGGYLFAGLAAGDFFVKVDSGTLPAGLVQTPYNNQDADFGNQDQTTDTDNDDYGYLATVAPGGENLTADFGYNWRSNAEVNDGTGIGAIGDRVWADANGDGVQNPEEAGIAGVTVKLYNDDDNDGVYDNEIGSTLTDANGNYLFNNLPAGGYVVEVTTPPYPQQTGDPDHFGANASTNPSQAGDNKTTTPIVLGPGDVFLNADFGYDSDALRQIGDTIWFDVDGDGTYESGDGEYGLNGITVALIRDLDGNGIWDPATEPIVATDTTDTSGQYLFTGLTDDDYMVWVNDTDNVLSELVQTGEPDNGTNNGQTCGICNDFNAVTLSAGDNLFQDFGYAPVRHGLVDEGLIGDTIFLDRNGNGDPDAGEGIEGVIVRIYQVMSAELVIHATTQTDENGLYSFGELDSDGTYKVVVDTTTLPPGLTNTVDPDDGTANESTVDLSNDPDGISDGFNLEQDFGYEPETDPGSIGDLVWLDTNADGFNDGPNGPDGLLGTDDDEPGIAGVTIDLYADSNGDGFVDPGEPLIGRAVTGANGDYLFSNLPTADNGAGVAGADYIVDVTDKNGVLGGYWHSLGAAGTNDNSQADPYAVILTSTERNDLTADFGYYVKPAAVGNFVWDDNGAGGGTAADGIQDPSEPGISGVVVTLEITWPNGDTTIVKTTTDNTGWYGFGNLLLDEDYSSGSGTLNPVQPNQPAYKISVETPTGYSLSPVGDGSRPMDDSNNHGGSAAQVIQGKQNIAQNSSNPSAEGNLEAGIDFGFYDSSLAVTISYVHSERSGDDVFFNWQTAAETGVAGFNIFVETAEGLVQLNGDLIASKVIDSVKVSEYEASLATTATIFYIQKVGIDRNMDMIGPFQIGQDFGSRTDSGGTDPGETGHPIYLPTIIN